MSDVEKLYEMLKKLQEPKGYFFNRDKDRVFELLQGLIVNKERYGYMACPCRLASADFLSMEKGENKWARFMEKRS